MHVCWLLCLPCSLNTSHFVALSSRDGQRTWVSTSLCLTQKPEQRSGTTCHSWVKECLAKPESIVSLRHPQPPSPVKWTLDVETLNSSHQWPAKLWLSITEASVILLQEHHLPPERCKEAEHIGANGKLGKAFSLQPLPGGENDSRSWSAGLAILARHCLG